MRLLRPGALAWSCVALGSAGCSGVPFASKADTDAGDSSGAVITSTTATTSSTSSSSADPADGTGTSTSTDSTGMIFLPEPDGGGGTHFGCDIFAQDCRPGEKCTPWAHDGGNWWNGTKCVPVVDDPAEVGEPCHVESSRTSGVDDCDFGTMCFYIDPETLEGICTPFCTGDEVDPQCEEPNLECSLNQETVLILCLPRCNPLQQDCPWAQACYPVFEEWDCFPDASGESGAYGDACESINVCDPGLICLGAAAVPSGEACEGSAGCCTEICDITHPAGDLQCAGAAGGQTCQSWYEDGSAPLGYENVGACALPA